MDGRVLVALDGTEFFRSRSIHCQYRTNTPQKCRLKNPHFGLPPPPPPSLHRAEASSAASFPLSNFTPDPGVPERRATGFHPRPDSTTSREPILIEPLNQHSRLRRLARTCFSNSAPVCTPASLSEACCASPASFSRTATTLTSVVGRPLFRSVPRLDPKSTNDEQTLDDPTLEVDGEPAPSRRAVALRTEPRRADSWLSRASIPIPSAFQFRTDTCATYSRGCPKV